MKANSTDIVFAFAETSSSDLAKARKIFTELVTMLRIGPQMIAGSNWLHWFRLSRYAECSLPLI